LISLCEVEEDLVNVPEDPAVCYLLPVGRVPQPSQVDRGQQEGGMLVAKATGGVQQISEAGGQSGPGVVRAEHPLSHVLKQVVPQGLQSPGS